MTKKDSKNKSLFSVEIRDVSKSFNSVKALKNISLNINKGEFFSLLGPLVRSSAPGRQQGDRSRRQGMGIAPRQGGNGGPQQLIPDARFGGGGFASQRIPVQPPSEDAIANLVGMGFERQAVIRALQASGNNIEVAANRLLSGAN